MSANSPNDAALVGTVLDGAYQLNRLIFEGGMGTVYEAVQLRLSKRVAVKVMVPDLAENPEALGRFKREVEITSQLHHPHVIQLLDFGVTPSGQPYLVMEYLDGEDLEHRLQRVARLPLAATVEVVRQICSALTVIHGQGIVHRDLKPANVFLLPMEQGTDFVKVVDFGISKVTAARTKLTRDFTMVGTPECMSPEQATARPDEVDHRADQWAVACVAWRMLSGRMPFWGSSLKDLLHQIVHLEPAPLSLTAPELPHDVETVLRRALAKKKENRFPTISAFVRAFETAARPEPQESQERAPDAPNAPVLAASRVAAPSPARGRAATWVLAVVTTVALAVGGALVYQVYGAEILRRLSELR